MNRVLIAPTIALAMIATPLLATAGVGVAVNIGAPNYYATAPVVSMPAPPVVYRQPVVAQPAVSPTCKPKRASAPVVHRKVAHRSCNYYSACSQPIYVVDDYSYQTTYVPTYYPPTYYVQTYDEPTYYYPYHHGWYGHRGWYGHHRW